MSITMMTDIATICVIIFAFTTHTIICSVDVIIIITFNILMLSLILLFVLLLFFMYMITHTIIAT